MSSRHNRWFIIDLCFKYCSVKWDNDGCECGKVTASDWAAGSHNPPLTNWFPSVLWHCWFGHLICKNRPRNDPWSIEWDVKPLHYHFWRNCCMCMCVCCWQLIVTSAEELSQHGRWYQRLGACRRTCPQWSCQGWWSTDGNYQQGPDGGCDFSTMFYVLICCSWPFCCMYFILCWLMQLASVFNEIVIISTRRYCANACRSANLSIS